MSTQQKGVNMAGKRKKKGERVTDEETTARFRSGTFDRIDGVLRNDETRTGFIREAVEKEIRRRMREARSEAETIRSDA
jgi:hypothetical protein